MKEFIDKTSEQEGTPINRANLMAAQGFSFCETTTKPDGSIVQDFGNGETLTITIADGVVTEVFSGEKTITKKTQIMPNQTIREWIE